MEALSHGSYEQNTFTDGQWREGEEGGVKEGEGKRKEKIRRRKNNVRGVKMEWHARSVKSPSKLCET